MKALDLRRHIAHIGTTTAILDLELQGYTVQVNGHNDHADLIVNGILRVEIKASLWTSHKTRAGRYQFNTRQRPDVYLLYCLGHNRTVFIIPGDAIGDRANLAIWSKDPWRYKGQWAKYRHAWDIIEQELARCLNPPAPSTDDA
jgi:hypothetical protein